MKSGQLLVSLIGLVIGFCLIISGFFLFLAPHIPALGSALRVLVLSHLLGLSQCGLILVLLGVGLLFSLGFLNRRRYLLLKMGGVSVQDRLIETFALDILQAFFPEKPLSCHVIIKNERLEILANLPPIPENQKDILLAEIEHKLSLMLQKQFHYQLPFIFNINQA